MSRTSERMSGLLGGLQGLVPAAGGVNENRVPFGIAWASWIPLMDMIVLGRRGCQHQDSDRSMSQSCSVSFEKETEMPSHFVPEQSGGNNKIKSPENRGESPRGHRLWRESVWPGLQ